MTPEADWAALWEETRIDLDAPAREERTPRWRGQQRLVEELFGSIAGLDVIEVGSGQGLNALLYGQHGANVTLLDNEQIALDHAALLHGPSGVTFTPVLADVFDLPGDLLGAFDVSMSFGLCEHFVGEQRKQIIAAHLALLRPGGVAMIGVPNRLAPGYRLWKAVMTRRGTWIFGTEKPFAAGELASIGRAVGGEPLKPIYGSFISSLVSHLVNQGLYKLGRPGVPVPQHRVPLLDRFAYELVVPIRRPA
ncbi:MAG TPA: class I SAM-dependent methyltransferase [Gaiellaceae bacterium]|jgi:SAM-dependent methyltransferase